jgi:hypothetical protein
MNRQFFSVVTSAAIMGALSQYACAQTPQPAPAPAAGEKPVAPKAEAPPRSSLREVFPHVRVDTEHKLVEFDGTVPIDARTPLEPGGKGPEAGKSDAKPRKPEIFLEVVVCTPDTKEHETLVVTEAKPSHIHAALLMIGLKPGEPGKWEWDGKDPKPIAPTGDALGVTISYKDAEGKEVEARPQDWIVSTPGGKHFGQDAGDKGGWVFAGSKLIKRPRPASAPPPPTPDEKERPEVYAADGQGVLIGLTTFGSETVAWKQVISPDSGVQEPEWIADPEKVPGMGTAVTVRLRPGQ